MDQKDEKRKKSNSDIVMQATDSLPTEGRGKILSDVLGSYTGLSADGERPEQDADDL